MQFPVLIVKQRDPSLYYFEENTLGLVSKNGESFYKKGELYDALGNKYEIQGYENLRNASLVKSIKYMQQMYVVDLKLHLIGNLTLDEFKEFVKSHIDRNQNYWIKRDVIPDLQAGCMKKDNFGELMKYLK